MFETDVFNGSRPRLGVSSCLLGNKVRYNGGHSRDRFVAEELDRSFQWIPICPEVGMGMGVPREPIRLVGDPENPLLMGVNTGNDYTEDMLSFSRDFIRRFGKARPHGFIFKNKSPSCGMARIPVYNEDGGRIAARDGLFAAALKRAFPLLPVEESGRLNDIGLRENFIKRVFAFQRLSTLLEGEVKATELVRFHTDYKLVLMSHDQETARRLGRLVGKAGNRNPVELLVEYAPLFMACLSKPAGVKRHANVLYHLLGFLKDKLSPEDKHELVAYIENYRKAMAPLSAPLILLSHHFRRFPHHWSAIGYYLQPYPSHFLMRYSFR